jgi:hypothetical protein
MVAFAFYLILPIISLAQYDRVSSNESENLELKERIKWIENQIEEEKILLSKANAALEISEKYSDTADSLVTTFMVIWTLIFTAAGVIGFFTIRQRLNHYVIKNIEERISKQIDQQQEIIHDLITKHSRERIILNSSRLLIINKDKTTINPKFKMVINRFSDPISKDIKDLDELKDFDFYQFDAVIFDNTNSNDEKANWDFSLTNNIELKNSFTKIVENICSKDIAFIYFGNNKQDGKFAEAIPQYSHLISFSNFPATVFANLIDLLDFRRLYLNR